MSHKTRILSALWMIPLAVLAILYLPTPYFGAVMALILMAGLYEWAALANVQNKVHKLLYLLFNAAIFALIAFLDNPSHLVLKLCASMGGIFWLLCLFWLWQFNFARAPNAFNRFLKLSAGSLACIALWAAMIWLHSSAQGPIWTLIAIGVIAAADSGAYVFGVNFGKNKLAPNISPGKSWEGFWGGLVCAIILALICMQFMGTSASAWKFAVLGLLTGLFSVVGDLLESLLKRHAAIKDSSSLIPGHGGLLDRLDSILSGVVIFTLVKFWLGL
ncbi:MAG: phosphatidate cytidylyltransferase [Arenimonas sp.]|nr:phosphatidate cytidylyltransferase [Arenimonas sp.]